MSRRTGTYCRVLEGGAGSPVKIDMLNGEVHEIPEAAFHAGMIDLDSFKHYARDHLAEIDLVEQEEAARVQARRQRKAAGRKRRKGKTTEEYFA